MFTESSPANSPFQTTVVGDFGTTFCSTCLMKPECKHATCKSKFCPHCGEEIESLSPVDDVLSYMKEQVRVRRKQLKDATARQQHAASGKVGEIWNESYRSTRDEFVSVKLNQANNDIEKATRLLAKWEARFKTVEQLIDAAKIR